MRDEIRETLTDSLKNAVSDYYLPEIVSRILDDVIEDIEASADPEEWNEDDVRLAVGRVLLRRFGYEI